MATRTNVEQVCVIGACNVDLAGRSASALLPGDSNPGLVSISWGGVARNVAENLARLGMDVRLYSAVGEDAYAESLTAELLALGVVPELLSAKGVPTPSYLSILEPGGEMVLAVADTRALDHLTQEFFEARAPSIASARLGFIDTNISSDLIGFILERFPGVTWFLDPVSATKAVRAKPHLARVDTITPNLLEARALTGIRGDSREEIERTGRALLEMGVENVVISLAERGLCYANRLELGFLRPAQGNVVAVSGAGDALAAGLIHARARGLGIDAGARWGLALAHMTLGHNGPVHPDLSATSLEAYHEQIVIEHH